MQSEKVILTTKLHLIESVDEQSLSPVPNREKRSSLAYEERSDVVPVPPTIGGSRSSHAGTSENQPGRLPLSCEIDHGVLFIDDGFRSQKALKDTICRVSLVSGAYLVATTALTLLGGFYHNVYGLGPIEMAVLNAISIVFFVVVMLPFCLFSAWCLRYNQESPYQQRFFELTLPARDAFELSMAAMESLPGTSLANADTNHGIIKYIRSGTRKFGRQEISVKLESLSRDKTRIQVTSHPKLGAVQYLLFGYTLAVDGSQNKRNLDEIVDFLTSCAPG